MAICSVKIDKNDGILKQTEKLVSYLDKRINEKKHKDFVAILSKLTDIPVDVINYDIKKTLTTLHNFKIGEFSKKFNSLILALEDSGSIGILQSPQSKTISN